MMHPVSRLVEINPRNEHFHVEGTGRRDWHGGDPVKTIVFNAFSVMFPEGEKFVIDSVRGVRDEITDSVLSSQVKGLLAQEAMHTREHVKYNWGLDAHGFRASELHLQVRAFREKIVNRFSLYEQVAGTAALEHFTAILSDMLLSDPAFLQGADEEYRRMWLWHALEEIEHKGVAYDVFAHLSERRGAWFKGYFWRVRAMFHATLHFSMFLTKHIFCMMQDRSIAWSPVQWGRMFWFLYLRPGMLRRLLLPWLRWFVPGFHPWRHDNRDKIFLWEKKLLDSSGVLEH